MSTEITIKKDVAVKRVQEIKSRIEALTGQPAPAGTLNDIFAMAYGARDWNNLCKLFKGSKSGYIVRSRGNTGAPERETRSATVKVSLTMVHNTGVRFLDKPFMRTLDHDIVKEITASCYGYASWDDLVEAVGPDDSNPDILVPVFMKLAFLDKVCELEPERLSCDGELDEAECEAEERRIWAEWRELEEMCGREVSYEEANYEFYEDVKIYMAQCKERRIKEFGQFENLDFTKSDRGHMVWFYRLEWDKDLYKRPFYIHKHEPSRVPGDLWANDDSGFILYSAVTRELDGNERIGEFKTLKEAYTAGVKLLEGLSYSRLVSETDRTPKRLIEVLQRALPEVLFDEIMAR